MSVHYRRQDASDQTGLLDNRSRTQTQTPASQPRARRLTLRQTNRAVSGVTVV